MADKPIRHCVGCGHCKGHPVEALRAELECARPVLEAALAWRSAVLAWQSEADTPAWNAAVSRLAAAIDAHRDGAA